MWWPFPTKSTSPNQFLVLVAVVAIGLFLVGALLIYLSVGQPPEKHELAMDARWLGIKVIGGSVLLGTIALAVRRFIE